MALAFNGKGGGGGGGSSPVTTAKVSLSSANLLALGSAVRTLVAAPGAGLALVPIYADLTVTDGSNAYSSTVGMHIGWGGVGTAFVDAKALALGDDTSSMNAGGAGQSQQFVFTPRNNDQASIGGPNALLIPNAPLTLDNDGDALTGGNGTAVIHLVYATLSW